MTLPNTENIPALTINIEGLKRHDFLMIFSPNSTLSIEDRRLRAWLLHTLTTAARHYTKTRELVNAQNSANQERDGGAILYLLDVSEQIEGSVAATHRLWMAISRLEINGAIPKNKTSLENLRKTRNQYEHMHSQITSGQTGAGPLSMEFCDEGKTIKFRDVTLDTTVLCELINEAYVTVAAMYPDFNVNSPAEPAGPSRLNSIGTISQILNTEGRAN